MKQSRAVTHLRCLMSGLQKYRSVTRESLGASEDETIENFLAETWPWVFGNKCPLPTLTKMLNAVDSGKTITPHDYYNIITAFARFIPYAYAAVKMTHLNVKDWPDPVNKHDDFTQILRGWDNENN